MPLPERPSRGTLPIEITSYILAFIQDESDLARVCLASRAFSHEGTRILYHSVRLDSRQTTQRFSSSLQERPALGRHVVKLTLFLECVGHPHTPPSPENLAPFARILSSVQNLPHLAITSNRTSLPRGYALIFQDCPFRLLTFNNGPVAIMDTLDFLDDQPEITEWTHLEPDEYDYIEERLFEDPFLPNLVTMNIDAELLTCFRSPRPVKQLRLRFCSAGPDTFRAVFRDLRYVRDTLLSLDINCSDPSNECAPTFLLEMAADSLPALKHFALLDEFESPQRKHRFSGDPLQDFVEIVSRFENLQTFVYSPAPADLYSIFWNIGMSVHWEESVHPLARALFAASPKLCRIAFPLQSALASIASNPPILVTYSRGVEGAVGRDRAEPLTFVSWRNVS
ncbi:hypothetical protein JAAARDRAFT_36241 [Jaapia argillacea MUCL 33604]|uniref:F-box domain-containing protein n=1 Tax=Jaapia argillacea MUCL 33604 TaxID=933084 RepID=A0A067PPM3_9AGAM|nr:hypothetical protein JAAARDRAFT_36241 [Jaapia argillacea MUCL 33604]